MAGEHEEFSTSSAFNFNIDNGAYGNQDLIESFLDGESATEDPNKVKKIEEEPKKEVKTQVSKKEEVKKPDGKKQVEDLLEDKETEEEEEETSTDPKKEEKTEESTEFNAFNAFSKELFKLGVFALDEDEKEVEINTPEEFLERFNSEAQRKAQESIYSFIGQFGEPYQEAFEAIYQKGVDPREYFTSFNKISNLAEMDLTSEANQVAIVREGLLEQGVDPEHVNSKLERIKNNGDLEEEAKLFHKVLAKKEAQKLQDLEDKKEQETLQKTAIKQQYVRNVNSILTDKIKNKDFDGIPINPKLAGELQDFLLKDKWKLTSGETITDFDKAILDLKKPENHAQKVKIALLMKIMEKDPTLSTVKKSAISKEANTLFSEVVKSAKTGGKSEKKEESAKWFV